MYIYYLFLFLIDRGSESTGATIIGMKKSQNVSKIPTLDIEKTPSVTPSMYKPKSATPSTVPKPITTPAPAAPKTTTETVRKTSSDIIPGTSSSTPIPLKPSYSGKSAKKSILKTIVEFIAEFAAAVKNIIVKPFKFIAGFFGKKLQPVKENEAKNAELSKGVSLIDQYMKEYEKKKKG